ncbi:tRNA (N6-threonylcarbamoyladenosine(37)-N6)-methyltransferase TrmO [bacterium]|nr:tRNA (N6-threonylcarbamoyladenosine(37)-N6)-methyltransferase TrmO [bacterium]
MKVFEIKPIGVVHSPLKSKSEAPIQPKYSEFQGKIEVFPEFTEGLKDVKGFSLITVIFVFDRSDGFELLTYPYLGDEKRGVFATRSPYRPNRLGISVLQNLGIEGRFIEVSGLDILDKTPIIDIKPYVPGFIEKENLTAIRSGWLENCGERKDGVKRRRDSEKER